MTLEPTIKAGDVLASVSVLVASLALATTWVRDRRQRRREHADRIRKAAAETSVALSPWKDVSLSLYQEIQPLITDMDGAMVRDKDVVKARDGLWRGVVAARAENMRRVLSEKIETAYVGLYGYHPAARERYDATIREMTRADQEGYRALLNETQEEVLRVGKADDYPSARLGNAVRARARGIARRLGDRLDVVLQGFQLDMLRLIELSDDDLWARRFPAWHGTAAGPAEADEPEPVEFCPPIEGPPRPPAPPQTVPGGSTAGGPVPENRTWTGNCG